MLSSFFRFLGKPFLHESKNCSGGRRVRIMNQEGRICLGERVNSCSNLTRFTNRSLCSSTMGNPFLNPPSLLNTSMTLGLLHHHSHLALMKRQKPSYWADFIDKKVFEAGGNIWKNSAAEAQEAAKEFIEILKQLEEAQGDKDFFGGKAFGYVDVLALPLTSRFLAYEKFGGFKVEDHCPKFSAWIKRCLQRETVSKFIPDPEKIYELVGNLRKMNGIE